MPEVWGCFIQTRPLSSSSIPPSASSHADDPPHPPSVFSSLQRDKLEVLDINSPRRPAQCVSSLLFDSHSLFFAFFRSSPKARPRERSSFSPLSLFPPRIPPDLRYLFRRDHSTTPGPLAADRRARSFARFPDRSFILRISSRFRPDFLLAPCRGELSSSRPVATYTHPSSTCPLTPIHSGDYFGYLHSLYLEHHHSCHRVEAIETSLSDS